MCVETYLLVYTLVVDLGSACVVVATDDEKIAECCRGFGADVMMTSESCRNGMRCCIRAPNCTKVLPLKDFH